MAITTNSDHVNFVVILCDNLGYGDLGCYGHPLHRTPSVDRMAEEGMLFTDFYVTSGVCTPSRASLMTGCYAQRIDMHKSDKGFVVLQPLATKGLNPDEITIARLLRGRGYATGCIGKWHLGDQPPFLPTRHGFDYYFGIPYSEDMVPSKNEDWPPLPLMRNEEVIEAPVHLSTITERYTREAVEFIERNAEQPFLLYVPQALPGSVDIPEVGEAFAGQSGNAEYGDSVEELDWSTGEILSAVQRLGLDERTLVIFTSDNGTPKDHGGSNAPLRGWGYSTWEGGMRVPCVMRWPGHIPAGHRCGELCTTMDVLPTFARIAGTEPPKDRTIDGHDIRPLLYGEEGATSPYRVFYYYHVDELHAVRSGRWKLHLPRHGRRTFYPEDAGPTPALLFDVVGDPGETKNVADQHPDVVATLMALAEDAREELGDTDRPGKGIRPAGHQG